MDQQLGDTITPVAATAYRLGARLKAVEHVTRGGHLMTHFRTSLTFLNDCLRDLPDIQDAMCMPTPFREARKRLTDLYERLGILAADPHALERSIDDYCDSAGEMAGSIIHMVRDGLRISDAGDAELWFQLGLEIVEFLVLQSDAECDRSKLDKLLEQAGIPFAQLVPPYDEKPDVEWKPPFAVPAGLGLYHRVEHGFRLLPTLRKSVREKPVWNKDTCVLTYRGKTIRRVRGRSVASNVPRILDAFEEDGWPERIDDPLPDGKNPQRLRETIRSLNEGLKDIRFFADGSGEGIRADSG